MSGEAMQARDRLAALLPDVARIFAPIYGEDFAPYVFLDLSITEATALADQLAEVETLRAANAALTERLARVEAFIALAAVRHALDETAP